MTDKLQRSWNLVAAHPRPLLTVVSCVYLPFYLLYFVTVAALWLPDEAADKLFGLIGVLLMPIANAMVVFLTHHWRQGVNQSLTAAFAAARQRWSKLLTAYISVSFIILGWLAVTVLPGYALLMILKVKQPLWLLPLAAFAIIMALSRYAFLDPLIVTQGLGPWEARQRSAELVRGRRAAVIGYGLLTFLPPFLLESGGELLADYMKPDFGLWPLIIGTCTGFGASILYVIPVVFFYTYYQELATAPLGGSPAAAVPPGGRASELAGVRAVDINQ